MNETTKLETANEGRVASNDVLDNERKKFIDKAAIAIMGVISHEYGRQSTLADISYGRATALWNERERLIKEGKL